MARLIIGGWGGSAEGRPANDDTPLACDYSLLFYILNNKRTFAGGERQFQPKLPKFSGSAKGRPPQPPNLD